MTTLVTTQVTEWRDVGQLARVVGAYCWVEHRLFSLAGGWAASNRERGDRSERRRSTRK